MNTVSAYKELEYIAGFVSRPGRGRKHNEDDYTIFSTKVRGAFGEKNVQTVVIADGSGGGALGKVASRLAVQTLYQMVINYETMPIQQRLTQAVHEANGAIFRQALLEPQLANMRTAISAIAISSGWLCLARVGDSQVYIIRGGKAYRITSDSTFSGTVGIAVLQSEDLQAPALFESQGLLGSLEQIEVDNGMFDMGQANSSNGDANPTAATEYIPLLEDDRILICTKSVSQAIDDAQIASIATQFSGQEAADRLMELATKNGTKEDITAVILQRQNTDTMVPVVPPSQFAQTGKPRMKHFPKPFVIGATAALIFATLFWLTVSNWTDGATAVAQEPLLENKGAMSPAILTAALTTNEVASIAPTMVMTATKTATPKPTNTSRPTATEPATETATETVEPTATETETETPTPTKTATALPTNTTIPTLRAVAINTLAAVNTPVAANTTTNTVPAQQLSTADDSSWWKGQLVTQIEPVEHQTLINSGSFSWTPFDQPLPEGYGYEIVFWRRGEDAMTQGLGWAGVTRDSTVSFNFDRLGVLPSEYNWGVLLVKTAPTYQRIAQVSAKRLLWLERK